MKSLRYFIKKRSTRGMTLVEMLISFSISIILMTGLLMATLDIGRYAKRIYLLVHTQRESNAGIQNIVLPVMSGSEVKFFNPDSTPFTCLDLPDDGIYNDKSGSGGVDWTNMRNRDGLAFRVDLNDPPTPLEGDDSWQGIYFDETSKQLVFVQNFSTQDVLKIMQQNVERYGTDIPVFNVPRVGQQNDLVEIKYKILVVGYAIPSVTEFLQGSFSVLINTAVKLRNTKNI